MKKKGIRYIKKYTMLTIACGIFGIGVALFVDPNDLAPGGFTGLAIMINRLIPVNTGMLYLILNIPVILLGIRKFGWKFTVSTLYSILAVSLFTDLFHLMTPVTYDPLLGAVFGGALIGVGIGLVMRNGGTTGGADIVIKCLKIRIPHMKTGTLMLMLDAAIIGMSGIVFGNFNAVLYGILSSVATSVALDFVLYGGDEARLIYIISDKAEGIAEKLLEDVDIGVTFLNGSGAYHNTEKKVIMCVVKKQLAPRVEEVVENDDQGAFMIITNASEIYGEGYKSFFADKGR